MPNAPFPSSPAKPGAFVPKPRVKRAAILRPSDIRHVLRVIDATSRWPERDAAAFLISVCAGLRCTEIARITVADVMLPCGVLREEVALRAAITKGCRPRTAYFTHSRLVGALERYLADRVAKRIGMSSGADYRGLLPDLPVVCSSRRDGFALVRKRRTLESGVVEDYEAADGLEMLFRRIYDKSGLPECSSHAGRRTFASALLAKGVASEDVSKLLGHVSLDHTTPYLECSEAMLEAAFRDVF